MKVLEKESEDSKNKTKKAYCKHWMRSGVASIKKWYEDNKLFKIRKHQFISYTFGISLF